MNDPPQQADLVVIKAGGSLLRKRGGVDRLREWLESVDWRSIAKHRVLLIGGGPVVDGIRAIDRANPLPTESTHWAAIDALDANARMLCASLPSFKIIERLADISPMAADSVDWLLAPGAFLREEEPHLEGRRLPVGWEVTSDSIAARLAGVLRAPMVLVKCTPPSGFEAGDWLRAAELGYVDPYFPELASATQGVSLVVL